MAKLTIRDLSKSFGNTNVIHDISCDVSEGEFCILLGPSGCGKTTVLRLIAGLEHQDNGEIHIDGKEVSNLTPRERDVAMVFQSYALYPHMSVYENMAFSLKIQKRGKTETDEKVKETAKLLGLEDLLNRKPKELSGGQRQRVAIGRAIVRNPKLFLFDEPLSNLDAKLRGTMRVEIAKLHQKLKSTIVYVTHDQVEAMTLGEKIILMDKGRILQVGTPYEMYNYPSNILVASFIGTPRINLIDGLLSVKDTTFLFKSENFEIDVSRRIDLGQYVNQEITMGLRPETLIPGNGPIKGHVDLVEHLGPEILVYVMVNGTRLIAKAPPDLQVKRGDAISLALSNRGIHFFHDGKRLVFD